jgi:hypothetical protein
MGRLLSEQGRPGAESKASDPPKRRQQGGAHAAFRQQRLEARQVTGLVTLHLRQLTGDPFLARRRSKNGALATVNVHCAELACMVHPQDFGQARRAGAGAGA